MKLSQININLPQDYNNIDNRVDEYLRGVGKNTGLADGLSKQQRYWIGPQIIALSDVLRCCGPESDMEYQVTQERFDDKIARVSSYITSGNQMEPLLCEYTNNTLVIRDGNHRSEALKQLGIRSYRILIWSNSQQEYQDCLDYLHTITTS